MSEPTKYPQIRAPEDENKLTGQSLFEIRQAMHAEEGRLRRNVRLQGRKIKVGPLISLYCLWCLTRPPEERERIAREMATLYERLQSLAEPGDIAQVYEAVRKEIKPADRTLGGGLSFTKTLPIASVDDVGRLKSHKPARNGKAKNPPVRK